ncbi:sigma 54-interacting transcriptional regulator [Thermodesulfobacteriota bacterium]
MSSKPTYDELSQAVKSLMDESSLRKQAEESLQERLKFEQLISELSATFVKLPASEVDKEIKRGLRLIVETLNIDRSNIFQFDKGKTRLQATHSWEVSGVEPAGGVVFKETPFVFRSILRGEISRFSSIDDLPEEAAVDKQFFQKAGQKAGVAVPLKVSNSVVGALTIGSFHREQVWRDEQIQRFILVGEIFANALMRKQTDENLQNAFSEIRQLKDQLELENVYLREEIEIKRTHDGIIGKSDAINYVLNQAEQVAVTNSTVLIMGETGTGKELLAKGIHQLSSRKERAMVNVSCANLPTNLIESELFGREKGAYTGALSKQAGRFEIANGSTLFLDEISELPISLQAKLLRVLQDGQFERLGSTKTIKVDARVIAATNRNLTEAVQEGKFREDLYYRLNIFPITMPPLRERPEDIPTLVWAFVKEFGETMGKLIENIPQKRMAELQHYTWPGNVRELRNVIERAMILSKDSTLRVHAPPFFDSKHPKPLRLKDIEKKHILEVLEKTGWRVRGNGGAAEILGLKPTTLDSRIKKLGIKRRPQLSDIS